MNLYKVTNQNPESVRLSGGIISAVVAAENLSEAAFLVQDKYNERLLTVELLGTAPNILLKEILVADVVPDHDPGD